MNSPRPVPPEQPARGNAITGGGYGTYEDFVRAIGGEVVRIPACVTPLDPIHALSREDVTARNADAARRIDEQHRQRVAETSPGTAPLIGLDTRRTFRPVYYDTAAALDRNAGIAGTGKSITHPQFPTKRHSDEKDAS